MPFREDQRPEGRDRVRAESRVPSPDSRFPIPDSLRVFGRHDPQPNRQAHQLRDVPRAKSRHHLRTVRLDRLARETELAGDVAHRHATREKTEYFALAPRETTQWRALRQGGFDRRRQFFQLVLADKVRSPRAQRIDHRAIEVLGDEQDRDFRMTLSRHLERVARTYSGDIPGNHDVRLERLERFRERRGGFDTQYLGAMRIGSQCLCHHVAIALAALEEQDTMVRF